MFKYSYLQQWKKFFKREKSASSLRMACLMDEFTFHSFKPEADLLQLHPKRFKKQIKKFNPDLLFVESAWQAKKGSWSGKINCPSHELIELINYCQANHIPSMLWSKEDPVHFSSFIHVAKMVDTVFTTDIDCIAKYKTLLDHERVFLLPFAVQQKSHNPVEIWKRKEGFNFAGSYNLRYPERSNDFERIVDSAKQFKPVEIYDRNYGNRLVNYKYPKKYRSMIQGKLSFKEIGRAYKGYRFGINLNAIKQSQTMFARRVFELLGSNTVVVSNFSRGLKVFFGDCVIASDDPTKLEKDLERICSDELYYKKLRLLGLRKVMSEHTYRHRLDTIRNKLLNEEAKKVLPLVAILAVASTNDEQQRIITSFEAQQYKDKRLYLISLKNEERSYSSIKIFSDKNDCIDTLLADMPTIDLIGLFLPADYYGPHYLTDLALAATYSDAESFAKLVHYQAQHNNCILSGNDKQYGEWNDRSQMRMTLTRTKAITIEVLRSWLSQPSSATTPSKKVLAVDEFNYCQQGSLLDHEQLKEVMDLQNVNTGIVCRDLYPLAESIPADEEAAEINYQHLPHLSAERLYQLFQKTKSPKVTLNYQQGIFFVESQLAATKKLTVYSQSVRREDLYLKESNVYEMTIESMCLREIIFEFQNARGKKISRSSNKISGKFSLPIPSDCEFIRLGFTVKGSGITKIHRLVPSKHLERPSVMIGCSPILIVIHSANNLYENKLLAQRIKEFKSQGLPIEVMILSKNQIIFKEQDGIDVMVGDLTLLHNTLRCGRIKCVLVDELTDEICKVLKNFDSINVEEITPSLSDR